MQTTPEWQERVAAAYTLPREGRAGEAYVFNAGEFANFIVPTRLLVGENSHQRFFSKKLGKSYAEFGF